MKNLRAITYFILLCATLLVRAQPYGNEWIDYNQTYYRFSSDKTGLHRLSFETLAGMGISLDASSYKLYARGEQIPLYTTTDGVLAPGDYIEFYGQRNDGYFDTQLYWQPEHQCNEDISLFSDSIAYFLTSDENGEHKRYNDIANAITGNETPEPYFIHRSRKNQNNLHNPGKFHYELGETAVMLSDFGEGEGFVGPSIQDGQPYNVNVFTKNNYTDIPGFALVQITTAGRIQSAGLPNPQHLLISVDNVLYIDTLLADYSLSNHEFLIPLPSLGLTTTSIHCEAQNVTDPITGIVSETKYAPVYATITYPHTFALEMKSSFLFSYDIDTDTYFEITEFNGGSDPNIYDLSTGSRIVPSMQDGTYAFVIPHDANAPLSHQIYISNTTMSDAIQIIEPTQISERQFTDYSQVENQGQYIIITHPQLRSGEMDWVEQYRQYRLSGGSTNTPGFPDLDGKNSTDHHFDQVVIADIEELYDQYAHGIPKHPLAIKNFINAALHPDSPAQWNEVPDHCFIVGKGVKYPAIRYSPTYYPLCLVPTYGHQPSDVLLMSEDKYSYLPQLAIGRLPAQTPEEVKNYLSKMIEYEGAYMEAMENCQLTTMQWMKNALYITKGWGQEQLYELHAHTLSYLDIASHSPAGISPLAVLTDSCGYCSLPSTDVENYIEEGLNFISYLGHSTGLYWQFDINSPDNYENEGQYPFILSNAPYSGQQFETTNTSMAEEWVLADGSGAIGYLGGLFLWYPDYMDTFSTALIHNLFELHYGQSIGSNIKQTIADIYDPDDIGIKVTCLEFSYTGDPATKHYHFDRPEYMLDLDPTYHYTVPENIIAGITNYFECNLVVFNTGMIVPDSVEIELSLTDQDENLVFHSFLSFNALSTIDTLSIPVLMDNNLAPGLYSLTIKLDPQNLTPEYCDEVNNNIATYTIPIQSSFCTPASVDTDNDGICDEEDQCINLFGTIGDLCDDGNPDTMADRIQADCICSGITAIDAAVPGRCSIYPQPASRYFILHQDPPYLYNSYYLYFNDGTLISSGVIDKSELFFDTGMLPAGIYILALKSRTGAEERHKLMIHR